MSEENKDQNDTERIAFRIRPDQDTKTLDSKIGFTLPEASYDEVNEAADRLGFDRKAPAYRYFLTLGITAIFETDPRNSGNSTEESSSQHEPLTIRDVLPDTKSESLNMKNDELVEAINQKLLDEVRADPEIETEGFDVWLEN